ncbi:MAG: CNP1-like family protein [Gammaproteobacteria bacterium]
MMKILLFVAVALLLSVDLSARDMLEEHYNRTDQDEFEFDDSDAIWQEQASQVPPVSIDALKPLKIDHGPQGMRFFIDQKSIAMNRTDRVTRYWLAAKNGGRIVSLNFEEAEPTGTIMPKSLMITSAPGPRPIPTRAWLPRTKATTTLSIPTRNTQTTDLHEQLRLFRYRGP